MNFAGRMNHQFSYTLLEVTETSRFTAYIIIALEGGWKSKELYPEFNWAQFQDYGPTNLSMIYEIHKY